MHPGIATGASASFGPRELQLRISFPNPAMYWTFRYLTTNDISDLGVWPRNNSIGAKGLENLLKAFASHDPVEFPPNTSLSVRKISTTMLRVIFAAELVLDITIVMVDTLFLYFAYIYARVATYICSGIVKDRQ